MSPSPKMTPAARPLLAALLALAGTGAAQAADCPGHPDAIGVARTIVVDPREHPRIGSFQYPETLPLRDKEVVISLDDAPRPASLAALDALDAACVKATYFTIGRHAQDYPDILRKIQAAGHTLGTHSQTHPLSFNRMAQARIEQEIDTGIASVRAVLGEDAEIAPFFRIPGLLRSDTVESVTAQRGLMLWSTDVMAHDWKRRITVEGIVRRAIDRLEAKGKGILLLHDIHPKTVAALPLIFAELKQRGYRIVHVQPATKTRPKTPTEPQDWQLHPPALPVLPALLMSDVQNLDTSLREQHAMSGLDFCGLPATAKTPDRLARLRAPSHRAARVQRKRAPLHRLAAGAHRPPAYETWPQMP